MVSGPAHSGVAFSLSPGRLEDLSLLDGLLMFTSNCHLSTFSPVSLLVMTTTSFDILPLIIHRFNCDMIFLMYALTWSSFDTEILSIAHTQKPQRPLYQAY